jgi:hypothetical protein
LLHEVLGDDGGSEGTSDVQNDALENHSLLFVESEEGSEHEEGVDADSHNIVGGVGQGNGPAKMSHRLGLEGAELLATNPFGRGL